MNTSGETPLGPAIFGHRGASGTQPENTIAAFEAAIDQGAAGVELDVRRTRDGVVVVHHDGDLPDGRWIVDLDAADLPPSIPTLVEVFDICRGRTVNVEIKSDAGDRDFDPDYWISDEVVRLAIGGGVADEVIVTSFDVAAVDQLRARNVGVRTGWISMLEPDWDRLEAVGHQSFMPWYAIVDDGLISRCRDLGLLVGTWTVNRPADALAMAKAGVDVIMTDYPDAIRSVLEPNSG